ncbi:MAG TPA: FtsX-like permease family protein [Rhodanobacteraceae bacterium]
MKYFHLVWSALMRRKTRTVFTMISIIVAFLLFGMLDSVRAEFSSATHSVQGASTLMTVSKLGGLSGQLPLSLQQQIAAVPGVTSIAKVSFFGGYYQKPQNMVAPLAVGKNYFEGSHSVVFPPGQLRAFQDTRDSVVVGAALAKKYHWKIGDRIPLKAAIWPRKNGSNAWSFEVVGIFHARHPKDKSNEQLMFVRWKYFDEAREYGNSEVAWYQEKIADPKQASRIATAIDALSANSSHETKTQTANAFASNLFSQIANIGLIVTGIMAAVFFTLILLTGNTMAQAVRERIPELAVLKTIGFSNRSVLGLVLAESVLLVFIGGVIGMGLSTVVMKLASTKVQIVGPSSSAAMGIDGSVWGIAIALMIVIGLVVGILPAWRGMRLKIVDALAGR